MPPEGVPQHERITVYRSADGRCYRIEAVSPLELDAESGEKGSTSEPFGNYVSVLKALITHCSSDRAKNTCYELTVDLNTRFTGYEYRCLERVVQLHNTAVERKSELRRLRVPGVDD